jgi:hypothetical protein
MDIVFIGAIGAVAALAWAMVWGCARLGERT